MTEKTTQPITLINIECSFDVQNTEDVAFITEIAAGWFVPGQALEGRALNTVAQIEPERLADFERRVKAMAPFLVSGGTVTFNKNKEDQIPFVRFIVRDGKVVREVAKVTWSQEQGSNNQGGNFNNNNKK